MVSLPAAGSAGSLAPASAPGSSDPSYLFPFNPTQGTIAAN